jgi:alanine racemase
MRPVRAAISLDALRHNLAVAKERSRGARLWAVVKANAYGHGLRRVGPALAAADGLALLETQDAVLLRENGWAKPLLMLEGFFNSEEVALFARQGFTAVIHQCEQIDMLERARIERPLDIYLKLNTGMNRLGLPPEAAPQVVERLRASGRTGSIVLMTHFAEADGAGGIAAPLAAFDRVTRGMDLSASTANSAALLRFPESHRDWVRPGIMLYGCSPFAHQSAASFGLQPVMTLKSRVIALQAIAQGERIGYSGAFTADRPMRVGVVACGYADGYPRHAPAGTPVLVGQIRSRTLGLVSMDMLFVDLTDLPEAGVGSEVTLWGEGLSADEVALAAGTVSYELLCALSARVPVTVTDHAQTAFRG